MQIDKGNPKCVYLGAFPLQETTPFRHAADVAELSFGPDPDARLL
jgi:hypothetical protein